MKESFLEIHAQNLIHNFNWYKSVSPNSFVCPMIKANAYGVGEDLVFQILKSLNPSAFGVVRISEALSVRQKDPRAKILMFNPCDADDYKKAIEFNITPVISNIQGLKDLEKVLIEQKIKNFEIHIEIDTGMNRLGIKYSHLDLLFETLDHTTCVSVTGVFSHFLSAEDWPHKTGKSFEQLNLFKKVVNSFVEYKKNKPKLFTSEKLIFHLSSSKAINEDGLISDINKDLFQFGFRPGLGLYGISQNNKNLKPVLSLKSPILDLKWVDEGETVSYDGIWKASKKSLIGVLPLGYGDGYPRSLAEKSYVLLHQHQIPIVGKICMDFMMIDCTQIQNKVRVGDLALVFGYESEMGMISIEDLSERAGMITYELIVRLSSRLKRTVLET